MQISIHKKTQTCNISAALKITWWIEEGKFIYLKDFLLPDLHKHCNVWMLDQENWKVSENVLNPSVNANKIQVKMKSICIGWGILENILDRKDTKDFI